jgi:hypothetical protein
LLQILLAIGVLVGGFLILRLFVNSPLAAWACLLLLLFATQATTLFVGVIGAIHFYPGDALTILLLVAGVVRVSPVLSRGGLSTIQAILFLALVVFSLVRGVPGSGLSTAGNLSREYLALSSAILYFSTFSVDDCRLKKYAQFFLWYCGALVIVALLRYAGLAGWLLAPPDSTRMLNAAGANSIAVGFLLCLCWHHYYAAPKFVSWLTPVFGAMAILLQHRTVWVVLIAMMVSALLVDRGLIRKFIPVLVVGALLSGMLGAVIFGSKVREQFETSATDEGTFQWRVEGWKALLGTDEQTPLTYAVGLPSGTKFALNETLATAAGHSEYMSALLHVGVLGLCILLGIVLKPAAYLYGLRRMRGVQAFPGPVFWVIFSVSVLAFGFTYTITWDQAALLGIASSIVITRSSIERSQQEHFA